MSGLLRGDACRLPLRDESVDLIVTSPPYWQLRSYRDDGEHYDGQLGSEPTPSSWLAALWTVTAECMRVLKPTGSLFVNLGDKYSSGTGPTKNHGLNERTAQAPGAHVQDRTGIAAGAVTGWKPKTLLGLPWRYAIGCVDHLGLILRAELIWSKTNGMPETVTDRVRRSHEQWFHFTRQPHYFAALDEVREPVINPVTNRQDGTARHAAAVDAAEGHHRYDVRMTHPLGKVPGSVWPIASEKLFTPDALGVYHFAAFPQEWPRRLILGWSPAGYCTACGEPRRPTVERDLEHVNYSSHARSRAGAEVSPNGHRTTDASNVARELATITGYSCACADTRAPTRPAVVLDPFVGTGTTVMVARGLGRTGVGVDLSADYLRLATWRVYRSRHAQRSVTATDLERQGTLL